MKPAKIVAIVLFALVVWLFPNHYSVRAQTATIPLSITVAGTHTGCLAPATGQSAFCFASDGLWQSLNGAAYVQLGTSTVSGVTSWNGLTGAVTYTPPAAPVTSVNGKTGVVTITANTTLQ